MARQYFLIKSEPDKYAWEALVRDGQTRWDGVRNFEARNTLRAMQPGDLLLYYHSNQGKEVVGIAEVVRAAYPDPTADSGDWSAVDIVPCCPLKCPVSLEQIRNEPRLAAIGLLKRSRLSVVPVTKEEFDIILSLGMTVLNARRDVGKQTCS